MIDRRLNYGRHHIKNFLKKSREYKVVLDLGAGQGNDLLNAGAIVKNAELHAVESYPEYISILQSKGIKVHDLNIERDPLPFKNESVDVIICNQILEHCKEIWWILHEISRVLKKNGKLIIGIPNLASLHNRFLLSAGRQPTSIQNNSAHVRGYTKNDLLRFLKSFEGGYKLISFGGSNFYPFPAFIAKPLAAIFPTFAWGIFFLLEKRKEYNEEFLKYPQKEKLETNFYLGEK